MLAAGVMAFQALEVPRRLIEGRTSNTDEVRPMSVTPSYLKCWQNAYVTAFLTQVALITRAGSLGRMLDSYIASVCAFWESQGAQIAVRGSLPTSQESFSD